MARLGIVVYHGIESGPELGQYGKLAERAGFESIWVTERYFHEETFSMLGYLAASTNTIRLGVGVVNPFTRHPALLAMAAATTDRISGGRLILGLGRSDRPVIEGKMGVAYDESRAALGETVGALRRLLAGETETDRAGLLTMNNVHLGVSPVQSSVPIYLAGIGPKALRLAGAVADGVLLNAYVPTEYVRFAVRQVRAGAADAGRDPDAVDIACMTVVRPTEDPAKTRASLKQRMVRLLDEPHVGEVLLEKGGFDAGILGPLRQSVKEDGGKRAVDLVTDEMVNAFYLVGSQSDIKRRVGEYRAAGVTLPLLLPRLESFGEVVEMFAG